MRLSIRCLHAGTVAIAVLFAVLSMPTPSSADQSLTFRAPFDVAKVCYKVPVVMYYSHCPPEKFQPAATGVLLAGGGKSVPNTPPLPNAYLPYIESMSAGVDFTAPEGGTLTVVAELSGIQAGTTTSSEVCLMFSVARSCSVDPVTSSLTASTGIAYKEMVTILVQARTSYPGIAGAVVETITLTLIPDDVVY